MSFGRSIFSGKEVLVKPFLQSLILVIAVWVFFTLLGYERGLQWHSVRRGLEGIVLLTAVAGLVGKTLDKKVCISGYCYFQPPWLGD